jgi:Na+-driven multidrug efflux pump
MAADSTLGGALRGAGDTRFPLLTVVVGFYGARLVFAWCVAHVLHLGLAWVWGALLGDYLSRALLKAWRLRSGRWHRLHA